MSKFMPVNESAAAELNEKLSETIFKNAADFVNFYNSGLINRKNEDVVKIVSEVTATFKDVKDRGGELVFLSQPEVLLNEVVEALGPWEILVKTKREVTALVEQKAISEDTVLAFNKKNAGYVLRNTEDGEFVKVGGEKLFSKMDDVEPVFERNLISGEKVDDSFVFYAMDVLSLDDSFITRIHESLPTK